MVNFWSCLKEWGFSKDFPKELYEKMCYRFKVTFAVSAQVENSPFEGDLKHAQYRFRKYSVDSFNN